MKYLKRVLSDIYELLPDSFKRVEGKIRGSVYRTVNKRIIQGPLSYSFDGLHTIHNADFLNKDIRFQKAFEMACKKTEFRHPSPWRVYVNCWAIKRAINNCVGDLVECGTWRGTTALAGILYSGAKDINGKKFFLIDSWEGIDETKLTEHETIDYVKKTKPRYSDVYDFAKSVFDGVNGVELIKGFIPDVLPKCNPSAISYLHIDMNSVYPEICAIEFFFGKLEKGAVVVLDDYGFIRHVGQKKAFDEFCLKNNYEVLLLPTGQGLIIK